MKRFLLALLGGGLLAGGAILPPLAAAGTELTAVGARDASGARTGDYKITDATGNTRARGRFEKDRLEGKWLFFDTHQVKVAEITYHEGVPSGPYRTYFGSKVHPAVAGKLESEGWVQGGGLVGHHVSHTPDGKASKAFFEGGDASHGKAGPDETVMYEASADLFGPQVGAAEAARLDLQFIHALDEFIRPALR